MSNDFLRTLPKLFIQQRKELVEIVINWETTNRYAIFDEQKNEIGFIAERPGGLWSQFRRGFLRSHRGFEIDILARSGEVAYRLSRKFFFIFSALDVSTAEGQLLGRVERRFGIIKKKYDLKDSFGKVFATIASPIWRIWTFPIVDSSGVERGKISKKWGGVFSEVFTDSDTYLVEYGNHSWNEAERAVILAAAVSVDFDFFENNQGNSGIFSRN